MTAGRLRLVARMGPVPARTRWFAGSLAAHVAVVVAITVWPADRGPLRGPLGPSMAVDLVAGVPGPRASVAEAKPPPRRAESPPPKAETPPPPKPKPKPREAALEPRQVEIDTAKKTSPETEPVEPEPIPPDPTPPPPSEESGETGAGETGPGGPPAGGQEDVGVAGDVGGGSLLGSEYAWYAARVTAALRAQWRRPPLGNVRQDLTVVVAFEILRSGNVRDPRVVQSSGVPSLDRSALRAVVDAQPLPALPRDVSASAVPARFEFTWYPGDT